MEELMNYYETKFDESYERIMPTESARLEFFDAFYKNFFDASPDISSYFKNTDMQRQKSIIIRAFYALFSFYASHQVDDILEKIAVSHSKHQLNIKPELYELWLESFIKTVKSFDAEYDDDTELGWRLILSPGIVYMKFKYDKAQESSD